MRLTDNNLCKANPTTSDNNQNDEPRDDTNPYCYADFGDFNPDTGDYEQVPDGTADFCANPSTWINPAGVGIPICTTEDGRVLNGGTASTRARWAIKRYTKNVDEDADGELDVSAWVVMGEEKMKALGDPDLEPEELLDIGKNVWYHTFEFNNPELVQQGLILNAPAINPDDENGDFFLPFVDPDIDHFDGVDYEYYETEIARRF